MRYLAMQIHVYFVLSTNQGIVGYYDTLKGQLIKKLSHGCVKLHGGVRFLADSSKT